MCLFSAAQSDQRPALLAPRPHLLPQRPDLSRRRTCRRSYSGLPLRAAAGRVSVSRRVREPHGAQRAVPGRSTRSTASRSARTAPRSGPAALRDCGDRAVGLARRRRRRRQPTSAPSPSASSSTSSRRATRSSPRTGRCCFCRRAPTSSCRPPAGAFTNNIMRMVRRGLQRRAAHRLHGSDPAKARGRARHPGGRDGRGPRIGPPHGAADAGARPRGRALHARLPGARPAERAAERGGRLERPRRRRADRAARARARCAPARTSSARSRTSRRRTRS